MLNHFCASLVASSPITVDLGSGGGGGSGWRVLNGNGTIAVPANVPGQIHSLLLRTKSSPAGGGRS